MVSLTQAALLAGSDRWDGPGPWWPLFPLLWFLLAAGLVATFVLIGRRNRSRAGAWTGESALAERFAAGEITEEEYRHRLGVLKEKR